MNKYRCELYTRKEFDKNHPDITRGWWYDVVMPAPTKKRRSLTLVEATQSDLDRCCGTKGQAPGDYFVEDFERGSLVHRKAIENIKVLTERD